MKAVAVEAAVCLHNVLLVVETMAMPCTSLHRKVEHLQMSCYIIVESGY